MLAAEFDIFFDSFGEPRFPWGLVVAALLLMAGGLWFIWVWKRTKNQH